MLSPNATRPIPWNDAMTLLKSIDNPEWRLMFAVGFTTAYRVSTYKNLQIKDLFQNGEVVKTIELEETKQSILRKVNVTQILKECFLAWHGKVIQYRHYSPEMYLFCAKTNPKRDEPITKRSVNDRIKRVCKKHAIVTHKESSHFLRKTFGRRMYEVFGETERALRIVQMLLGHRTIETTSIYIGLEEDVFNESYLELEKGFELGSINV